MGVSGDVDDGDDDDSGGNFSAMSFIHVLDLNA